MRTLILSKPALAGLESQTGRPPAEVAEKCERVCAAARRLEKGASTRRTACAGSAAASPSGAPGHRGRTRSARHAPARRSVFRVPFLCVMGLRAPPQAKRGCARAKYFFVSRTVLSRRAWRNIRVTATVTLFIILLDTTCWPTQALRRCPLPLAPQATRTVPTSARGMALAGPRRDPKSEIARCVRKSSSLPV
jgi:hypothetical protein